MIKKFEEIITLKRGFDLPEHNRIHGIYPLYAASGLSDFVNSFKIHGPGVITGRSGTIGQVFYTEEDFWPLNTTLFVADFHGNNEKYISYWLSTFNLENYSSGASVPTLNRNELNGLECVVHNAFEQQHIVDTIGTIDDLIEVKRQTIAKLDELAQKTFDAYFASVNEKTYALQEICDFIPGYSYKGDELKESSMGMVSIKCIGKEKIFRKEGIKALCPIKAIPNGKRCDINDILVCHTDLTNNQEIIGRPILIPTKGTYSSLTYSMDLVKVQPISDKFSKALVFRILNSESFNNHALGFCSGTTVVHLSKKALQTYSFNGPSQCFEKLSEDLQNYQNQIVALTSETDMLEKIKSLLLAKYFS